MTFNKSLVLISGAFFSLALAGCSNKTEAVKAEAPAAAVAVTTAQAVEKQISAGFEQTGSFVADEDSDVAPMVPGRVVSTPVDVGAWVKKGDVICELDHRDAQLRVEQAKAQLAQQTATVRQAQSRIGIAENAKFDPEKVPEVAAALANMKSAQAQARLAAADATRYANLVASGDVSRSAADKARTAQETAEAQANAAKQQYEAALNGARQSYDVVTTQRAGWEGVNTALALAEKALADTTIRAPFDGFITARPVAVGEWVAIGNKVATMVRISTLKLDIQAPEQRASQAHVGDTVIAHVAAFPGREFQGKLTAVNPSVDPASRSFILRATFNNPDSSLKPGMFASAFLRQPGQIAAVFVPRSAVVRDRTTDANQAFVIEGGHARLRIVQPGEEAEGMIRIVSGVKAGETVATSGQSTLYEGVAVSAK